MVINDAFVTFINNSLFLFSHVNDFISTGGIINILNNTNNPK